MRKRYKKYCDNCNKYYEGEGERFCSIDCAKIYRRNNPRIFERIKKECLFCKKTFELSPFYAKKRRFCSRICSAKAYHEKMKDNPLKSKRGLQFNQATTPKRKYYNLRRRAKEMKLPICEQEEFIDWYKNTIKICDYCGITTETWNELYRGFQAKFSLTIDRKDNSRGYVINNMTLACGKCNMVKNNILTYEEMKEIGDRYIKPKWQKSNLSFLTTRR